MLKASLVTAAYSLLIAIAGLIALALPWDWPALRGHIVLATMGMVTNTVLFSGCALVLGVREMWIRRREERAKVSARWEFWGR